MKPPETYILTKPEPFRSILLHIKGIVELTLTELSLKYKWSLPFYYINDRPFCYLNCTKGYVDIAFMSGNYLTKHISKLNGENRVRVKSLRYKTLDDIDDEVLIDVLNEAYIITANS